MIHNRFIVNGQGYTVKSNGGAGKYAFQLYHRLKNFNFGIDFPYCDISLVNFSVPKRQYPKKGSIGNEIRLCANNISQQLIPPILHKSLHQIFKLAKSKFKLDIYNIDEVSKYADNINSQSRQLNSKIVLHELSNYSLFSDIGRLCLSTNFLLAVTFLDIQDVFYPENFDDNTLTKRRLSYSFFKERANVFFAISDFTKWTMVEKLKIDPSRIKVIHLAADDMKLIKPQQEDMSWARNFDRFWMYPAKAWKHKNHETLIRALGHRRDHLIQNRVKFLLIGGFDKNDVKYLKSIIQKYNVFEIVNILGYQSDERLKALYQSAELLFFPSLFEGFGMPVLEAMTLGCPVICSNVGSLKEICGDSALYFDAKYEESFVSVIDELLKGSIDLQQLVINGKKNRSRFTWEQTFQKTIKEYKRLLSNF